MKYFKIFICLLLISVILSGCSFRLSSSIDDLISPLSPFGDNAKVKDALDRYASGGYTLKLPNYGDNISSFNFYDIDSDGAEEAFAFYEPSNNLGTINLAMIKCTDDDWEVICNITGVGKDVHSLAFAQLVSGGNSEVAVCWDAISNSSSHELVVYQYYVQDNEARLEPLGESKSVNTCYIADAFNSGENELLLFSNNSSSASSPKAELYSLNDGYFRLMGETKLDQRIATFTDIKSETIDGLVRIYADAITADGSMMITELLYWSDDYDSIISPFYSYSRGRTEETSRSALIPSQDVNGDTLFEIPVDYSVSKLPKEIKAVDFKDYKHSILIHNSYALVSEADKYFILIPDDYISDITVKYSKSERAMTLINKETKNTIITVKPVLKATYSEDKYDGFENIVEASGYCYLAKQGSEEEAKRFNELINSIKPIE